MVDPTSDLCEDVSEEDAPRCSTCSEPIANEPTHEVVTRIEDGTVSAMHFCNADCRAEWSE